MHDLLLTVPGDGYPFSAEVRVRWTKGLSHVQRWRGGQLVEQLTAGAGEIDSVLDAVLERLAGEPPVCRRCGLDVTVSASQFETFERMHYVCFHYEFEHGTSDVDAECTAGGCPSASIEPSGGHDEDRDELVEEFIETVMHSRLGEEALSVRIDRLGPGVVRADIDEKSFLISVRPSR